MSHREETPASASSAPTPEGRPAGDHCHAHTWHEPACSDCRARKELREVRAALAAAEAARDDALRVLEWVVEDGNKDGRLRVSTYSKAMQVCAAHGGKGTGR